jgi:hypothetical protein
VFLSGAEAADAGTADIGGECFPMINPQRSIARWKRPRAVPCDVIAIAAGGGLRAIGFR